MDSQLQVRVVLHPSPANRHTHLPIHIVACNHHLQMGSRLQVNTVTCKLTHLQLSSPAIVLTCAHAQGYVQIFSCKVTSLTCKSTVTCNRHLQLTHTKQSSPANPHRHLQIDTHLEIHIVTWNCHL